MRKRTFIFGSLALAAGTMPAFSADLEGSNKSLLGEIVEGITIAILSAYVEGVISSVESGDYDADSLAVAYGNLRALAQKVSKTSGPEWQKLKTRIAIASDMVAAAYERLPTTGDIADRAKELRNETISPIIERIPVEKP